VKQYHYMMWRGYDDISTRALYPKAGVRWRSYSEREPGDYEKRNQWKEDADKQLAEDQRAFARSFRPAWDLRTITGGNALSDIQSFVRDALNVAHWNQPTDNADVQRMLCDAVANEKLIPVVNREYQRVSRVAQPGPAPQSWPSLGGGAYEFKPKAISYDEFTALQRANGELPDIAERAGFGAALNPFPDLGAPASADDGFDLLGVIESAAGALPGGGDDDLDDGDGVPDMADSLTDGDDSTPLGDAQPFDYQPDMPDGDQEQVAARGVRMTGNEPGGFAINPNGQDVDYFDSDGNLSAQYHGSHGDPHGHNFSDGVRDNTHLPMLPINFD
jgi:hypothetical protein